MPWSQGAERSLQKQGPPGWDFSQEYTAQLRSLSGGRVQLPRFAKRGPLNNSLI